VTLGRPLVCFLPGRLFRHLIARKTNLEAGVAFDLRLRLGADRSGDPKIMKSTSPPWAWVALVVAVAVIAYVATPPFRSPAVELGLKVKK
jgi:hypothetical protein